MVKAGFLGFKATLCYSVFEANLGHNEIPTERPAEALAPSQTESQAWIHIGKITDSHEVSSLPHTHTTLMHKFAHTYPLALIPRHTQ